MRIGRAIVRMPIQSLTGEVQLESDIEVMIDAAIASVEGAGF